jgi:hypothetical protein
MVASPCCSGKDKTSMISNNSTHSVAVEELKLLLRMTPLHFTDYKEFIDVDHPSLMMMAMLD